MSAHMCCTVHNILHAQQQFPGTHLNQMCHTNRTLHDNPRHRINAAYAAPALRHAQRKHLNRSPPKLLLLLLLLLLVRGSKPAAHLHSQVPTQPPVWCLLTARRALIESASIVLQPNNVQHAVACARGTLTANGHHPHKPYILQTRFCGPCTR